MKERISGKQVFWKAKLPLKIEILVLLKEKSEKTIQ
jgi:hypothetical protein